MTKEPKEAVGVFIRRLFKMLPIEMIIEVQETHEYKSLEPFLRPNKQEIADYLEKYNKWRRNDEGDMPYPVELGEYLDYAIEELRK